MNPTRYLAARQSLARVGMSPDPFFPSRTASGSYQWRVFRNGQQYSLYTTADEQPTVELFVAHANNVDAERSRNQHAFGGAL